MSERKSMVDKVKLALAQAPLELHPSIVFMECRFHISKIESICSRLVTEDKLMRLPGNRQEVADDIYFNLEEIRKILWTAVEVSKAGNTKMNSDSEG